MAETQLQVSASELWMLYMTSRVGIAAFALLVFDWLLCLGQEGLYIWNWRSRRVTVSSLVYALSRYAPLIANALAVATVYPMSDLSCRATVWVGVVMEILGVIGCSAFSALRAYALSDRRTWLSVVIVVLALPPAATHIMNWIYEAPLNLPSPYNCSASGSLPPTLFVSDPVMARACQLAAEILVVCITWWYTFQSYRVCRDVNIGATFTSLLLYNGSAYFLFLSTLYTIDIILATRFVLKNVGHTAPLLEEFIDPLASILTCRFMLSLRQFDSRIADMPASGLSLQRGDHMALTVLEFRAQPSQSLPSVIAPFAHPVHVGSNLESGIDSDPETLVEMVFKADGDGIDQLDTLEHI